MRVVDMQLVALVTLNFSLEAGVWGWGEVTWTSDLSGEAQQIEGMPLGGN